MNFVSFGSLSKCRVVCASEELVLICPGCLSVRLCSRDSHVVPKKGIEQKLRVYDICVIRFTTVLVFFNFVFNKWGSIQNRFDLAYDCGTFYTCR